MASLHSITGLFVEDFPGISPWGGFFSRGSGDDDALIEGMLVDMYGMSRINGAMNRDRLEFRKQYEESNGNQEFDYKFTLKNGVWVGEYKYSGADYGGKSICKTALCLNNLNFRSVDLRTPEGSAKALIDCMIESGDLETSTDPKTGEIMVKLRDD